MTRVAVIVVLVLAMLSAGAGWLRERELRASESGAAHARFTRDSVQLVSLAEQLATARFATDAAEARSMAAELQTAGALSRWAGARAAGDSLRNRLASLLTAGAADPTSGEGQGAVVALDSILEAGDILKAACETCRIASAEQRVRHEEERRVSDSTIVALRRQVAEVPTLAGPARIAISSPSMWRRWSDRLLGGAVGGAVGYGACRITGD